MDDDRLEFKQIIAAQWSSSDGSLNHSIYGIAKDGHVYRFSINEGWHPIERATERKKKDRKPWQKQQGDF